MPAAKKNGLGVMRVGARRENIVAINIEMWITTTTRGKSKPKARILRYKVTKNGTQAIIAMDLSTHGVMKKSRSENAERASRAG